MKTLTVRLPDALVAEIDSESNARARTKSDIIRERLESRDVSARARSGASSDVVDLIGSVKGLPADLSSKKKRYLKASGYGRKHAG